MRVRKIKIHVVASSLVNCPGRNGNPSGNHLGINMHRTRRIVHASFDPIPVLWPASFGRVKGSVVGHGRDVRPAGLAEHVAFAGDRMADQSQETLL